MPNIFAIHSVGNSLVSFLRNSYPPELSVEHPCEFRLLSSGELASEEDFGTTLSLFLHRVTINEHVRNARSQQEPYTRPLSLDLHYLLTVWATNAEAEHSILAWAMLQLYLRPLLDVSSLSSEAGWRSGDLIQLIPADLTNEDIMRIWDSLQPNYRLSVSYVARVVRIDPSTTAEEAEPAIASRFTYSAKESPQ